MENHSIGSPAGISLDPRRVAAISNMLPGGLFALGPVISNRSAWLLAAKHPALSQVIIDAERKASEPVPAMTFEIYGAFHATGERTQRYAQIRYARHERIALFTLAECLENKGRFVGPLEQIIADVCTEPTWMFNFHDRNLDGWNGKSLWVDLGAILPASDMSQAMVLLGDRLHPQTCDLIISNCKRRILDPYRAMVNGPHGSWADSQMNWNAVCHAGVVTTALASEKDLNERAYFVAMAELGSISYLRGFGSDGYCSEGIGYWNYGFENFSLMSELILEATGGKLNFLSLPGAQLAARYPVRLEIFNGLTPSYADCVLNPQPDSNLVRLLNARCKLGAKAGPPAPILMRLLPRLGYIFSGIETNAAMELQPLPLRDYFPDGGVLTCRPIPGSTAQLGVSLKGGHNGEEHNHNDLGTFVVATQKSLLLIDPGLEVYSARTFNQDRYQSKLLNSFGHPVPVVAGKLQQQGIQARANIIRADFSEQQDIFSLDLTSAYDSPDLKQLTRTFTYHRTGTQTFIVEDSVRFKTAQNYGLALITRARWRLINDCTVVIEHEEEGIEIRIDTFDIPVRITGEIIEENVPDQIKPTRIGIDLLQVVEQAKMTLRISLLSRQRRQMSNPA